VLFDTCSESQRVVLGAYLGKESYAGEMHMHHSGDDSGVLQAASFKFGGLPLQ
jgi:hypothetical protein